MDALLSGDVVIPLLGALAATTLAVPLGIGVGALVRNQTAAVTGALVWVFVEAPLVGFSPEVGRWLSGGANSALTEVATAEGGLLPMWGGALLLAGYGLAFAAVTLGRRSTIRCTQRARFAAAPATCFVSSPARWRHPRAPRARLCALPPSRARESTEASTWVSAG